MGFWKRAKKYDLSLAHRIADLTAEKKTILLYLIGINSMASKQEFLDYE